MDEHIQEISEIIEASFLSKDEKKSFKDQLQKEGLSESFFAILNERLIGTLQKTGDLYEKIVDEHEAHDKSIRSEYEAKKNEIEAELDKKLVGVDITDLTAKEKIFDWYRKETEANQDRYDRALKALFSNLSRQAIAI
jgi:hypothetical protein